MNIYRVTDSAYIGNKQPFTGTVDEIRDYLYEHGRYFNTRPVVVELDGQLIDLGGMVSIADADDLAGSQIRDLFDMSGPIGAHIVG
jgi:hypothetical protein